MAEKNGQTKRARAPPTKTRETAELTKRIELWLMANGNGARTEALRQLLARGFRSGKRKVQRTKI